MLAVFENLKANEPKNHFTVGIVDDVTFTFAARRARRCIAGQAPARSRRASSVWAPTARWAPTRTRSRSSATRPTNTARPTSPTTRRNRAATPRSHLRFGDQPITLALSGHHARLRGLPRAVVRGQVRRAQGAEGRRLVPAQLRCTTPRRPASTLPDAHEGLSGQEQDQLLYHQRHEDRRRARTGHRAPIRSCSRAFFKIDRRDSVRQGRRRDEEGDLRSPTARRARRSST